MNIGSGPIFSIYCGTAGSFTIASSSLGSAAATSLLTSAPFSYARGMEVFNLTGRNLELVIGVDNGKTAYTTVALGGGTIAYTSIVQAGQSSFFVPGTASSTVAGRANRFPLEFQNGMNLWVRTTEGTSITASAAAPLIINFWA